MSSTHRIVDRHITMPLVEKTYFEIQTRKVKQLTVHLFY